jgi:hypothetical protein
VRARLLLFIMCATVTSGAAKADPLSIQPLLGISADYSSNPFLLPGRTRSANDEALLIDAPISYDDDAVHYGLDPSIRYGDRGSYSSLDSNYYHLTGTAAYSSELQSLTLTAGALRDSSLQQYVLASNGVGVRTDSLSAGLDWKLAVSERGAVVAGGSFSRALYNNEATATGLVNYRYLSEYFGPQYSLTERDTLQLTGSAGQYESLDGITASHSVSAQLGLTRRLTEIWTASASVGYSQSDNSQSIYIGPFIIGGEVYGPFYEGLAKFDQRGAVYGATLKRSGETVTLNFNASRAYTPTGFEYLSREDLAGLDLSQSLSERWSYAARLTYQNSSTPSLQGLTSTSRYYSGRLSTNWNWTQQWMVTLAVTWVGTKYSPPSVSAESTSVALQFSWQFKRFDLHL